MFHPQCSNEDPHLSEVKLLAEFYKAPFIAIHQTTPRLCIIQLIRSSLFTACAKGLVWVFSLVQYLQDLQVIFEHQDPCLQKSTLASNPPSHPFLRVTFKPQLQDVNYWMQVRLCGKDSLECHECMRRWENPPGDRSLLKRKGKPNTTVCRWWGWIMISH